MVFYERASIFWRAIFEISRKLRESERKNKEKREREMQSKVASFLFFNLGWEKVEEETWRSRVLVKEYCHWTFDHLISRITLFFFSGSNMNLCFSLSLFILIGSLKSIYGISFICSGLVLVLIVLRIFEWIFMIFVLSTSVRFWEILKLLFLDISIYIGLDLIIGEILIIFYLFKLWSVTLEISYDPLFLSSSFILIKSF